MTDDPFADTSPWDDPTTPPLTETPVTAPAPAPNAPAPFKIGLTVKAGPDYGAEWLTPAVYGHTAIETAARGVELLAAMKEKGLIEHNARFAQYTRDQYKGGANSTPKRFENGKVVAAPSSSDYTCEHGQRTFKDGGSWAAYFCGGRGLDKSAQCSPMWRQKDGTYRTN
ncbi:hypothetical protein [Streptomyces buecherae]|uniref:Uncharacterized protein n=1 Tax=Streptomyces buecherae TaxID=2763006 RepID=A0A7H8N4A0_9ACTN|nr:hypothetical protein [Streptomyces buecherae]QKW48848.1 hypothetical protein HUT08_04040 [Streptomyces buecherae]